MWRVGRSCSTSPGLRAAARDRRGAAVVGLRRSPCVVVSIDRGCRSRGRRPPRACAPWCGSGRRPAARIVRRPARGSNSAFSGRTGTSGDPGRSVRTKRTPLLGSAPAGTSPCRARRCGARRPRADTSRAMRALRARPFTRTLLAGHSSALLELARPGARGPWCAGTAAAAAARTRGCACSSAVRHRRVADHHRRRPAPTSMTPLCAPTMRALADLGCGPTSPACPPIVT